MGIIFIILLSVIVLTGIPFWYDWNGLLFKNIQNHVIVGGPDWHFILPYISYFFALAFTLYIGHRVYNYRWVAHPIVKVFTVLLCLFCWVSTASLVYVEKQVSEQIIRVDIKAGDDGETYYVEEPTSSGNMTFSLDEIAKEILPSPTNELILNRKEISHINEIKWLWYFPVTKGEKKVRTSYDLYVPQPPPVEENSENNENPEQKVEETQQ